MNVTVKFFAALRESVENDTVSLEMESGMSIDDIWVATAGRPIDQHVLVAINHQYASRDSAVNDGDEIAFFPPVTGG